MRKPFLIFGFRNDVQSSVMTELKTMTTWNDIQLQQEQLAQITFKN